MLLLAVTWNVYAVPLVNPVTTQDKTPAAVGLQPGTAVGDDGPDTVSQ